MSSENSEVTSRPKTRSFSRREKDSASNCHKVIERIDCHTETTESQKLTDIKQEPEDKMENEIKLAELKLEEKRMEMEMEDKRMQMEMEDKRMQAEREDKRMQMEKEKEDKRMQAEMEDKRIQMEKEKEEKRLQLEIANRKMEMEMEIEKIKIEADLEARRIELKNKELDNNRYIGDTDAMPSDSFDLINEIDKYARIISRSIPNKPKDKVDLVDYFTHIEVAFKRFDVPEELQSALVVPLIGDLANEIYSVKADDEPRNYEEVKSWVLAQCQVTPEQNLDRWNTVRKKLGESWSQTAARLKSMWRQYLNCRKVTTLEESIELAVCDKLKALMLPEMKTYVLLQEGTTWKNSEAITQLAEVYQHAQIETKAQSYDQHPERRDSKFKYERNAANYHRNQENRLRHNQQRGNCSPPRTRQNGNNGFTCFNCGETGHLSRACPRQISRPKTEPNTARSNLTQVEENECSTSVWTTTVLSPNYRNLRNRAEGLIDELQTVEIQCGDKLIKAVVDSGAQISVIKDELVPSASIKSPGKIKLLSAFGDTEMAEYAMMPMSLKGHHYENVAITCAISHKIVGNLVLSSSAYNALKNRRSCEPLTDALYHDSPAEILGSSFYVETEEENPDTKKEIKITKKAPNGRYRDENYEGRSQREEETQRCKEIEPRSGKESGDNIMLSNPSSRPSSFHDATRYGNIGYPFDRPVYARRPSQRPAIISSYKRRSSFERNGERLPLTEITNSNFDRRNTFRSSRFLKPSRADQSDDNRIDIQNPREDAPGIEGEVLLQREHSVREKQNMERERIDIEGRRQDPRLNNEKNFICADPGQEWETRKRYPPNYGRYNFLRNRFRQSPRSELHLRERFYDRPADQKHRHFVQRPNFCNRAPRGDVNTRSWNNRLVYRQNDFRDRVHRLTISFKRDSPNYDWKHKQRAVNTNNRFNELRSSNYY